MDYGPPGSSVHGILQTRILEWVAIPFSRGSSRTRDETWIACIAGRFFFLPSELPRMCAKSLQSCLNLCDTMDRTPPGSSVHGILQARILESAANSSSRGSSRPRDETCSPCTAGGFFSAEPPVSSCSISQKPGKGISVISSFNFQ